ncbi:hypothetical protein PGT21_017265 [Puccinia graminis f. sp. tritici]|uniref:Uncharacterized protein n=1 Tax=Puccinia graminis f. sp. tritici TaxID=56615 RepID=A0A5B0PL32_PUCGR|nr:hypothetical protein PGT21_017265 [Puccinia graminis f. sp. tritici]
MNKFFACLIILGISGLSSAEGVIPSYSDISTTPRATGKMTKVFVSHIKATLEVRGSKRYTDGLNCNDSGRQK